MAFSIFSAKQECKSLIKELFSKHEKITSEKDFDDLEYKTAHTWKKSVYVCVCSVSVLHLLFSLWCEIKKNV